MSALTWIAVILACAVFGPTIIIGGAMLLAAWAKHRSDMEVEKALAECEKEQAKRSD